MPIFYEDSTVRMEGNCAVEEAPALMEWLDPNQVVEWHPNGHPDP